MMILPFLMSSIADSIVSNIVKKGDVEIITPTLIVLFNDAYGKYYSAFHARPQSFADESMRKSNICRRRHNRTCITPTANITVLFMPDLRALEMRVCGKVIFAVGVKNRTCITTTANITVLFMPSLRALQMRVCGKAIFAVGVTK
jgi:hypothetical protein